MIRNILIVSLIATTSIVEAQKHNLNKNERTIKKIIGSWEFDYAVYNVPSLNGTSSTKKKSKVFYIDTLHFYDNMTYRFISYDSNYDNLRTHTGQWNVINNGRTLILNKRAIEPPINEPLTTIHFPIKIKKHNVLKINFSIDYKVVNKTMNQKSDNTPVFFKRIE